MEFNGFLVLAVAWFLLSLIGKARRGSQGSPRPRLPEPRPPRPLSNRPDATQQEGSRLELVLRELQRSLEEAAQPTLPPSRPSPPLEAYEEPVSLEVEPEVTSLEDQVKREVRRRIDRDDETIDIEAQRIQQAEARNSARTKEDHVKFDQRIRQEPADRTTVRTYTAQQLRDAFVWREILGPPVSLRGEGEK